MAFGAAVEDLIARRGESGMELLRRMYREWPFFRTLLSNMDMLLAKSDISIASRYAELVTDVQLRESIFRADSGRMAPDGALPADDHRPE